jgi:hypothetical protein
MHSDGVTIGSWVWTNKGCPVRYAGHREGCATFLFGEPPGDFEFGFDASTLREFLRLGAEAVREIEAT